MFGHSFALEPLSGHLASHVVFLYPLHLVACCLTEGAIVSEIAKKSYNGDTSSSSSLHRSLASLGVSVGQLSQVTADSNPLSSLWETVMSHLRHSTPACTDPSHVPRSINHPTVFHTHLGGWGIWTRGSRSTKRNPLSRAPMKRFAPAALEVIMHRLGSEP